MKIWAISDSHGFHNQLVVPDDIDMIIHAGDATNYRDFNANAKEAHSFFRWYDSLKPKYKLYVPGNHCTSMERGMIDYKEYPDVMVVDHGTINVEGLKIFCSSYTPTFGVGWAYNVSRHKLEDYWKDIEPDTDIVVTHGPPKGILDLSFNRDGLLEFCGDKALANRLKVIRPQVNIFGHIHNGEGVRNQGELIQDGIRYFNASLVEDGRFDKGPTSNGHVFSI